MSVYLDNGIDHQSASLRQSVTVLLLACMSGLGNWMHGTCSFFFISRMARCRSWSLDSARRVDCDHDGEEHQGVEGVKRFYRTAAFGCVVTFLSLFLAMRHLCISYCMIIHIRAKGIRSHQCGSSSKPNLQPQPTRSKLSKSTYPNNQLWR